MELLVTMKKRDSGIIRRKADFHFLVSADHHDILHYPARGFPAILVSSKE